jgi:hypothetical protein
MTTFTTHESTALAISTIDWTVAVRAPNKLLKVFAGIAPNVPHLTAKDLRKCKDILQTIKTTLTDAKYHAVNSLYHDRTLTSKANPKDRLNTLVHAIQKFNKLNAGVLTGGLPVKTSIINAAWLAYASLEVYGTDNAHFQQTNIPCDQDGVIVDDDSDNGFINEHYKRSEVKFNTGE